MKQEKQDEIGIVQNESLYDMYEIPCSDVYLNNRRENVERIDGLGSRVNRAETRLCLTGLFFDPVAALNKWLEKSNLQLKSDLPVYRWEDGSNVTARDFNNHLQSLLKDDLNYDDMKISSHSFRAGVASTMAKLGYGEEMIQLQGRWQSQAYLRYCRLGRANKLSDQYNLFNSLAREAESNNIQ